MNRKSWVEVRDENGAKLKRVGSASEGARFAQERLRTTGFCTQVVRVAETVEYDTSKAFPNGWVDKVTRQYRVGTFQDDGSTRQPRAYLRDYHPAWKGCVEITVMAASGKEAKRLAIAERMRRDTNPGGKA